MRGKELSKIHHPNVYLAGEVTESIAELILSCGTSSVKQGSKLIVKESLETIAKNVTKSNWKKLPLATVITKVTKDGSSFYIKTIDKTSNFIYRFLGNRALKAQAKVPDPNDST